MLRTYAGLRRAKHRRTYTQMDINNWGVCCSNKIKEVINASVIKRQVNQFCCLCYLASQVREAVKTQRAGALSWFCSGSLLRDEMFSSSFLQFLPSGFMFQKQQHIPKVFWPSSLRVCLHACEHVCVCVCLYTCEAAWPCQECSYLIISGKSQTFL